MNNQLALDNFDAELQEVQSTLLTTTSELTNPLGDLVRSQIKRSQPPIYGAIVLAVSGQAKPVAHIDDLHHKRILLAAALEMLHIALNVHRLLVNSTRTSKSGQQTGQQNGQGSQVTDAPNRAFIGSTILAGDYCFSRAAQMAAKSDNPAVVATFSLALQHVSESLLREQFHADGKLAENGDAIHGPSHEAMHQLLLSGAQAAAQLIGLSTAEEEKALHHTREIAHYLSLHLQSASTHDGTLAQSLPPSNSPPQSWQAFHQWLHQQRIHGNALSASASQR